MKRVHRELDQILGSSNLSDPQELAAALRISPATIYSWVRNDKISYLQFGTLIRLDPVDLGEWLAEPKSKKRSREDETS